MNNVAAPPHYKPEDLLTMPNGDRYELVNGELVEKDIGWQSSRIGLRIGQVLGNYCDATGRGWVNGPDAGYQCFPDDPDLLRKPDVSFIRLERMRPEHEPTGHCRICPDLAVEVISPNDLFGSVEEKVNEYVRASVRVVWVVDPRNRCVYVYRENSRQATLREADDLTDEELLPGFRLRVAELFRPPSSTTVAVP